MTLSQVPRELAERLVPHPQTCTEQYCTCTGWLIENRFRVEAVIREAMQRAQPQWISVEEHLPKQEVTYRNGDATWTSSTWRLCVEWDDDMEEFGHVIASYSETKGWSAMGYNGPPNITHWMPLPKPPNNTAASSLTEQETTK